MSLPMPININYQNLPEYLRVALSPHVNEVRPNKNSESELHLPVLSLNEIRNTENLDAREAHLLLLRHILTDRLIEHGKCYPPLVLERADTYEALEYADLAAFDAFTVYNLCLQSLTDEWVTDIEPYNLDGEEFWSPTREEVIKLIIRSLALLSRSLIQLGCSSEAAIKLAELKLRLKDLAEITGEPLEADRQLEELLQPREMLWMSGQSELPTQSWNTLSATQVKTRIGYSRREIYPWNEHEPDRNSPESLHELNKLLHSVAPQLEARVTALPALNTQLPQTGDGKDLWYQLGLFASCDLPSGTEVLREKSLLTAIRPLDDALCDACGQDLENIDIAERRECPGEDCDLTFCGQDCAERARSEYHKPAIENDESDDTTGENKSEEAEGDESDAVEQTLAPFCGNRSLHLIGRQNNTETPEWDLYFLLLTRTIAMSITQDTHPLKLPEIKYLWGDFITPPRPSATSNSGFPSPTLPFSVQHNLNLPLDFFTTLFLDYPEYMPYSSAWLKFFDPWIMNTLYAKYRGVANASQSTYDGKPEIASVHFRWCLANHSCSPNVSWSPTGERVFSVRSERDKPWLSESINAREDMTGSSSDGIKAGEEIFSHYTDVRLPVRERRDRLMEVLGGLCRCTRCISENTNASS